MVDSVHLFALRARRVGSGHCVVYSVHLVYERTNEVKFNMRLRLRIPTPKGIFANLLKMGWIFRNCGV